MSSLSTFFKGTDTHFGVFFPKHYLIAAFPDIEGARRAEVRLRESGFSDQDVLAVPGEDVVQLAEEHLRKNGVWAIVMQYLSRLLATEERYADLDLELASEGAAFLAVHCRSENCKQEAWRLIKPTSPLVARHYALGGIEHLVGES